MSSVGAKLAYREHELETSFTLDGTCLLPPQFDGAADAGLTDLHARAFLPRTDDVLLA